MSTGVIIAIVIVAAIIVVGVILVLPRMKEHSRLRASERELEQRRERVSAEHREQAAVGEGRADKAERRARIAAKEAERERAEAGLHAERAELHEQGLADDELVDDDERERFAGTSAVADRDASSPGEPDPGAQWRDRDRELVEPHDERDGDAVRPHDREPDTLHRRR